MTMLHTIRHSMFFLATLVLLAAPVWAKPLVTVAISTAKEVASTTNGIRTVALVPTATAATGDILHYTLTYTNKSTEAATNVVIDNPVPKGAAYVANSATGSQADITFSNDGGKKYAPPVKLTYEQKLPSGQMEKRIATPSDYTNIRWTIKSIAPGASGSVGFKVIIK